MPYATGSTGLAITVRGSSRRIMIMRFRPANIRLINRRSNLPRLLLALSSGKSKNNDNDKNNPIDSAGLTRALHIRPTRSSTRLATCLPAFNASGNSETESTHRAFRATPWGHRAPPAPAYFDSFVIASAALPATTQLADPATTASSSNHRNPKSSMHSGKSGLMMMYPGITAPGM